MTEVVVSGDIQVTISQAIANVLMGCRHDQDAVKIALSNLNKSEFPIDELALAMF